jgi:hypothetical protein
MDFCGSDCCSSWAAQVGAMNLGLLNHLDGLLQLRLLLRLVSSNGYRESAASQW